MTKRAKVNFCKDSSIGATYQWPAAMTLCSGPAIKPKLMNIACG